LRVLSETFLLNGIPNLAAFLATCEVLEAQAGAQIIEQGDADNSIFFVVSGAVEIKVNGRPYATRGPGSHIGEMSVVDTTARRSASVLATEPSCLVKASEASFIALADANPQIWRRVAVELSRRLKERTKLIAIPRTEPVIFIACSTEALPIAQQIQAAFQYDPFVIEIWTDGVFRPSNTSIEDLVALIRRVDFAVVVLTPDDKIVSRDSVAFGARDNVIFELGLAIGAIGSDRTILVTPRDFDLKLPSDLTGVKPVTYQSGPDETIESRLGPACTAIRKVVKKHGPI
jgi:predicted nucleotide-binding protein